MNISQWRHETYLAEHTGQPHDRVLLYTNDSSIDNLNLCEGVLYKTLVATSCHCQVTMHSARIIEMKYKDSERGWSVFVECCKVCEKYIMKAFTMWGDE
jgi:hypothetical protein